MSDSSKSNSSLPTSSPSTPIPPLDQPIEIRRLTEPHSVDSHIESNAGVGLAIVYRSGRIVELPSRTLREGCPCASCEEARGSSSHQQPLGGAGRSLLRVISSSSDQQLDLQKVWPVGNYAVGIRWGDGHDSGIFTFQQLLRLGDRS